MQRRKRDAEHGPVYTVGEGGSRTTGGSSHAYTLAIYIHYQVGWILGISCWEHGEPSLVPYDDLEGSGGGEEGGKGGRGWMYNYGRFELLYLRNQHTIVKKIFFN